MKTVSKIDKVEKYLSEELPNTHIENRIDRKDDESLYQPKIHSKRIRILYRLKEATGKPMTVLLDQAIQAFAASYGTENPSEKALFFRNVDQETWEEISEYRRFLDELKIERCSEELEKINNGVEFVQKCENIGLHVLPDLRGNWTQSLLLSEREEARFLEVHSRL